jgi:N-acetylglutamate synthase-like GNAT family acetyltransferase
MSKAAGNNSNTAVDGEVGLVPVKIELQSLRLGEDGTAFRTLNEEWISRYFVLEQRDKETLNHPERILANGGRIYFAFLAGVVVGTVALMRLENGQYELTKMAVSPEMRGKGIGRQILVHAIADARSMGLPSIFLASNSALQNAVHLYESLGFRHIPKEDLPWEAYGRADVFMEMPLSSVGRLQSVTIISRRHTRQPANVKD